MKEMKRKQMLAKRQTKLLNKENELLQKELEVSKFEFSEIIKQYNQGNIQNLTAKTHFVYVKCTRKILRF